MNKWRGTKRVPQHVARRHVVLGAIETTLPYAAAIGVGGFLGHLAAILLWGVR